MKFEFIHLFFCVVSLIRRVSFEGQWIVGILRLLFMIDVILAVLPIWKLCLVVTHPLDRGVILLDSSDVFDGRFDLESFKCWFCSCRHLHWVWVDNPGLLLKIESLMWWNNLHLRDFVLILLLIVRSRALWVGVLHKSVSAPVPATTWRTQNRAGYYFDTQIKTILTGIRESTRECLQTFWNAPYVFNFLDAAWIVSKSLVGYQYEALTFLTKAGSSSFPFCSS